MSGKSDERSYLMTSIQPATCWQDALPTGNGEVGAMVFGGIREERILLNHEALYYPAERPVLPDVSGYLDELRDLLAEERYPEAGDLLPEKLKEAGYDYKSPSPYHPAFDIELETATRGAFTDYRRSVDMATGEVSVQWTDEDADVARRLIVSRPDGLVALHVKASQKGHLDLKVRLTPHGETVRYPGQASERRQIPGAGAQLTYQSSATDDGWLDVVGRYPSGETFGGVARVTAVDGVVDSQAERVCVEGATEVLVLVKLFAWENARDACRRLQRELSEVQDDYDTIFARHAEGHRELFLRCRLDLGGGDDRALPNERLLLDGYNGQVSAALLERMFDFGRHLLICSSWGGSWPANLQGVWNGSYAPMWASDFHNNENIQMNYWQALPGNLPECTEAYFDFYERSLDDYRENARKLFGCDGIVAAHAQTTHGLQLAIRFANWTAGAGWLAQLFYDYWLFTGDEAFLRERAVPFMREVALFYEDFCTEDDEGMVHFEPSVSPENHPGGLEASSLVVVDATMDYAVARELLGNLLDACEQLGIEGEEVARWEDLLERIPEYRINDDDAIAEWMHPDLEDNYHHRHQSHLYPLFPGREITAESDEELFEAMRLAVEKRLVVGLASQTGWSLAHMANIYARLGEGPRALQCLELMTRSCVGANLLTYHNDWRGQGLTLSWGGATAFQIDANLGFAAAVLEMLVFSEPGLVSVLPGVPRKWSQGSIRGVRCRGCITCDLSWDLDAGRIDVTLTSDEDQDVTLSVPGRIVSIECGLEDASIEASDLGQAYRELSIPAGKACRLGISL